MSGRKHKVETCGPLRSVGDQHKIKKKTKKSSKKRDREYALDELPPAKRQQLVMKPKDKGEDDLDSEASTLLYEPDHSAYLDAASHTQSMDYDSDHIPVGMAEEDNTLDDMEEPGLVCSDLESLTSLSDYEEEEVDRPPNTGRWSTEEVDALVTACNVNRDAIKFNFYGPGGGKDVKVQGWKDIVAYVNDVARTNRTMRQCRRKASDYSMLAKAKYNKLRYEVGRTGKGKISKKLHLNQNQYKALDYLGPEPVKGIPGIEPIDLGGRKKKKPSKKNKKLMWEHDRESRPDYAASDMPRKGVPLNYREKNKRRLQRQARMKEDDHARMKKDYDG